MNDRKKRKRLEKTKDNKTAATNNHIIKKRTPSCFPKSKQDIYVNNKTNFKVLLNKCEKLFDSDEKEIIIHGLGKAITRACNLAHRLKEIHHDTLELDIKSSSVNLIDDFEPKNDDEDYKVSERKTSAIHIRVFRNVSVGALKFQK